MKYDVRTGTVTRGMICYLSHCYAKISCPMEYHLYPFDTQTCQFAMRSATKNMTLLVIAKAFVIHQGNYKSHFHPGNHFKCDLEE